MYSRDLYARLEAETGQSTGFKPVGLIEAAADTDRLEEYRRVAAFQRHLGLEEGVPVWIAPTNGAAAKPDIRAVSG